MVNKVEFFNLHTTIKSESNVPLVRVVLTRDNKYLDGKKGVKRALFSYILLWYFNFGDLVNYY